MKEAISEGWCENPTGLFINSCILWAKGKNTVKRMLASDLIGRVSLRLCWRCPAGWFIRPQRDAVDVLSLMRRFLMPRVRRAIALLTQ
ncbi:hypothetical protein [Fischerella sp. PCC 9605]|uniref:hypothetical protein n=1 Tax=Fischerella sp. PCC 9605 TaxID=1173024 RepID=UPI0012DFA420|nr:hypothetical protein [Fischerella sp. PCC 9605]